MFANLKKKIEAEVGDLSKLTPSFRSITQSERMTPLSSRQNSVSSLTSEPSPFSSNKVSSPTTEPGFQSTPSGANGGGGAGTGSKMEAVQQKIRRQYEEKMQTLESDFAWRLSSKDEEISKLQKQLDHLNGVLQSKEYETQQKLVRVQEDMDSLEGFSQQENAKIKHLLLNREEEVSQLRASVMSKDSAISEFESQVKNLSVENERLKKSLDEVVGRNGTQSNRTQELEKSLKEAQTELKMWKENQAKVIEVESAKLQTKIDLYMAQVQERDGTIGELRKKVESMSKYEEETQRLQKTLEDIKSEHDQERRKIEEQNAAVMKALNEEINKLQGLAKIAETCEEKDRLLQSLQKTLSEKEKSIEELQEKAVKLEEQEAKCNKLESQLSEIKRSNESGMQMVMDEKDARIDSLQTELNRLKTLETTISECQTREKQLVQELEDLKNIRDRLLKSEQENIASKDTLSSSLQQLQGQLSTKEEQIVTLKSKLDEMTPLKAQNEKLVLQVSQLQSRCDELAESNKQAMSSLDDMKALQIKVADLEDKLMQKTKESEATITGLQGKLQGLSLLEQQNQMLQKTIDDLKAEQEVERLTAEEQNEAIVKSMTDEITKLKGLEKVIDQLKEKEDLIPTLQTQLCEKEEHIQELKLMISELNNYQTMYKHLESKVSDAQHAHESEVRSLKENNASEIESLKAELARTEGLQSTIAEFESREKKLLQDVHDLRAAKESLDKSQEESSASANSLNVALSQLQSELNIKETMISTLQSKIEELSGLESEHSDLILQISEIQSRCDELEEENKFIKESATSSDDLEALKRRVADLEGELLNKTQTLKQQSLQLQDLRRSLAKEINKNQAMSESASPMEMASQCNGAMSQSPSSSTAMLATSQPPTLPPQETDVNFMYLRSVLFKYLTTTDVQVTQQLTRVVATLLHLSEEESHILSQAAESRNSFFHLVGKS